MKQDEIIKLINSKNRLIAEDAGGSQDAVNDPEWAKMEGIQQIEYSSDAVQFISEFNDIKVANKFINFCVHELKMYSLTYDSVYEAYQIFVLNR